MSPSSSKTLRPAARSLIEFRKAQIDRPTGGHVAFFNGDVVGYLIVRAKRVGTVEWKPKVGARAKKMIDSARALSPV